MREEMMSEWGLSIDHTKIYRWVVTYSAQINQRCRPYLGSTNDSWRVDETYIKVNGEWKYLWRTLRGYEIMNAIRKGQIKNVAKGDILGQRDFIHSLFGITV